MNQEFQVLVRATSSMVPFFDITETQQEKVPKTDFHYSTMLPTNVTDRSFFFTFLIWHLNFSFICYDCKLNFTPMQFIPSGSSWDTLDTVPCTQSLFPSLSFNLPPRKDLHPPFPLIQIQTYFKAQQLPCLAVSLVHICQVTSSPLSSG